MQPAPGLVVGPGCPAAADRGAVCAAGEVSRDNPRKERAAWVDGVVIRSHDVDLKADVSPCIYPP